MVPGTAQASAQGWHPQAAKLKFDPVFTVITGTGQFTAITGTHISLLRHPSVTAICTHPFAPHARRDSPPCSSLPVFFHVAAPVPVLLI